ncbi:solute carrier family 23 protein [Streptomyces sp. NPDC002172]
MATTGLQHLAAMYAGVVAPPLIVGAAIGLTGTELTFLTAACLFTAGLATFLQTLGVWRIGARLPFVNGVTFAGVAPMTVYHAFPETARIVLDSGISTGCVAAVVLNLVFNHLGRQRAGARGTTEAAVPLAAPQSIP